MSNNPQKSVNDHPTSFQLLKEKSDEDNVPAAYKNDIDDKSSETKNFSISSGFYEEQNICDIKDSEVNVKSDNNNQSFVISQITAAAAAAKNNLYRQSNSFTIIIITTTTTTN